MRDNLEGVIVPLLTPFTGGGEAVDFPALRRLVDVLVRAGVHGVIANAGTSEFYHLDDDERRRVAEVVVEQAAGRLPVLVGAGAVATRHVVHWARHAKSIGADGLLLMSPYYEPVPVDAIVRHFAAVSDAVDTPIMLYNTPFVTQLTLSASDIARLVDTANIPWVKLTTKNIELIGQVLMRLEGRVTLFEGCDTLAFQSFASGSRGWIAGPANALPDLAVDLWRTMCVERDLVRGYALHRRLLPFMETVVNGSIFCSYIKEVCGLRGYPLGATRAPFDELNDEQRRHARMMAAELGLVPLA